MPKNWCFWTVVLEKTLKSPLDCKEIQPGHPKGNQPWIFIGRTNAEAESLVLWPPHWKSWLTDAGRYWGAGGEGDDRGWDGWMASPTWWTWVWVNSGSWWWTGRPGVLQFMGSQRVRHDWVTELNWSLYLEQKWTRNGWNTRASKNKTKLKPKPKNKQNSLGCFPSPYFFSFKNPKCNPDFNGQSSCVVSATSSSWRLSFPLFC